MCVLCEGYKVHIKMEQTNEQPHCLEDELFYKDLTSLIIRQGMQYLRPKI